MTLSLFLNHPEVLEWLERGFAAWIGLGKVIPIDINIVSKTSYGYTFSIFESFIVNKSGKKLP